MIGADSLISVKRIVWNTPPFRVLFGRFPSGQASINKVISSEPGVAKVIKRFTGGKLRRKLPLTIEPSIHQKFHDLLDFSYEPSFVLQIKKGRCLFKECFVVTPAGNLIDEINPLLGRRNSRAFYRLSVPHEKSVKGKVAVLPDTDNYYHWLFETLPRTMLIQKSGIKPQLYVTGADRKFKKETLLQVGVPKKLIIASSDSLNLVAEELIAPSMPIHTGNPTSEVVDFLRIKLSSRPSKEKKIKYEKIYVMRGSVLQRRVSNESDVIKFLSNLGFTPVSLEGLSVTEQSELFASAKVVVAFHGAALANLVFCNKGTKVIEFFHPDYVNVCYWALSNIVGIDYCYFMADPERRIINTNDASVDIAKLESAFRLLGC
ncbi:MAG: glycosyltransferase family 61 protein [archaeon]